MHEKAFSLKVLFGQFFGILTNVEQGLWHTLWLLAVRPDQVINDYLSGKTRPYFNPFRLLVVISTVVAILTVQFHVLENQTMQFGEQSELQQAMTKKMMELMSRNFNLMVILSVPMYTLFSWLLLRKKGMSLGEHLILNSFLVSERQLVYAFLVIPFIYIWPQHNGWITLGFTLLAWGYYAWALARTFGLSIGRGIGYSLAINLLATIVYMVIIAVITLVGMIIYLVANDLIPT